MKPGILLCAFLALPAFSATLTGKIEKIEKDQLIVKSADQTVTLLVDQTTTVRKGKTFKNLSPLAVGDEIRADYYGEATRTAVTISAKVTFTGVITETRATHILVLADATPAAAAERKEPVFVYLQSGTKLPTPRSQLTSGKRVQVVGWDAGDGVVDAEKVVLAGAAQT